MLKRKISFFGHVEFHSIRYISWWLNVLSPTSTALEILDIATRMDTFSWKRRAGEYGSRAWPPFPINVFKTELWNMRKAPSGNWKYIAANAPARSSRGERTGIIYRVVKLPQREGLPSSLFVEHFHYEREVSVSVSDFPVIEQCHSVWSNTFFLS